MVYVRIRKSCSFIITLLLAKPSAEGSLFWLPFPSPLPRDRCGPAYWQPRWWFLPDSTTYRSLGLAHANQILEDSTESPVSWGLTPKLLYLTFWIEQFYFGKFSDFILTSLESLCLLVSLKEYLIAFLAFLKARMPTLRRYFSFSVLSSRMDSREWFTAQFHSLNQTCIGHLLCARICTRYCRYWNSVNNTNTMMGKRT